MILLIDNYDSFTYNLVQRLGELDGSLDIRVVRNDQITPDEAEAMDRRGGGKNQRAGRAADKGPERIIISPGPCTPKEAGVSSAIIERFAGRVPILGVCLGHQCMADLHGMTVTRHAVPMHGKTSPVRHDGRGVFAGLSDPFVATRYHSLVVLEETVPALGADGGGWEVSAWTDEPVDPKVPDGATRRVVMGLRRVWSASERAAGKTAPVEGVQFHPESFLTEEGPRLLANFLGMG